MAKIKNGEFYLALLLIAAVIWLVWIGVLHKHY